MIWETVPVNMKGNLLEIHEYAFENNLINLSGWKWAKKYKKYSKHLSKLVSKGNGIRNQVKFGF